MLYHHEQLQAMIDEAASRGGGMVRIPAGRYMMNNALRLRSRVHVIGEPGATLVKVPSVRSPLSHYLGYGLCEFAVRDPSLFEVGMGVHILDDHGFGFYTTVATIIDRDGDWFFIDRQAQHDYLPPHGGLAVSVFSLIEAENVEDAVVEGLTLDGNPEETFCLNGCRGGGVFMIRTRRVRLTNLEILNYNGDAVSFQQCTDIAVDHCHLHHNRGCGLHPGSGTVRYVMANNHVHDNEGFGLFYCLRTMYSICRDNRLENNAHAGLSIGERDTHHLIAGNAILNNKGGGVSFRKPIAQGGDHVRLENNTVADNAPNNGITGQIIVAPGLHDLVITGNIITPRPGEPAVRVGLDCTGITVAGNTVGGRAQQMCDVAADSEVALSMPTQPLTPVGPEAMPTGGMRHLPITP
ncbi:MAG: right-handed parallel beta-helix repeat-containing protein [Phycisphaeraceae bacterium]|nr:right-handed parallel beta-helix repeat-containing protein [Phycisphaeraceae bacterium]